MADKVVEVDLVAIMVSEDNPSPSRVETYVAATESVTANNSTSTRAGDESKSRVALILRRVHSTTGNLSVPSGLDNMLAMGSSV